MRIRAESVRKLSVANGSCVTKTRAVGAGDAKVGLPAKSNPAAKTSRKQVWHREAARCEPIPRATKGSRAVPVMDRFGEATLS